MSKTKKSTAGHYELLFIIPNKFTEEEAKSVISKTEKMISDNQGQITLREYWGKKKLAYEINHNAYGYYSLCEFDLEKSALKAIDNNLRLSADIIRHQIVSKKAKTEEELAREEAIHAKIEAKKSEEAKDLKNKSKKQTEEESPKSASKEDGRAELKNLDEKLEGILKAEDLIK